MSKSNASNDPQWTYAEQWQSYIEDSDNGDTNATRALIGTCIRFLRSKKMPVHVRLRNNKTLQAKLNDRGFLPEPFCSFLLKTLENAMSVPSKDVGKAMGIGNPPKKAGNANELITFMNHYLELMGTGNIGEDVSQKQRHAEVIEEIAVLMSTSLRSVQRYWKETQYLLDFWEPPEYEDNLHDD